MEVLWPICAPEGQSGGGAGKKCPEAEEEGIKVGFTSHS